MKTNYTRELLESLTSNSRNAFNRLMEVIQELPPHFWAGNILPPSQMNLILNSKKFLLQPPLINQAFVQSMMIDYMSSSVDNAVN
jgi:hypothetical protein